MIKLLKINESSDICSSIQNKLSIFHNKLDILQTIDKRYNDLRELRNRIIDIIFSYDGIDITNVNINVDYFNQLGAHFNFNPSQLIIDNKMNIAKKSLINNEIKKFNNKYNNYIVDNINNIDKKVSYIERLVHNYFKFYKKLNNKMNIISELCFYSPELHFNNDVILKLWNHVTRGNNLYIKDFTTEEINTIKEINDIHYFNMFNFKLNDLYKSKSEISIIKKNFNEDNVSEIAKYIDKNYVHTRFGYYKKKRSNCISQKTKKSLRKRSRKILRKKSY